MIRPLCHLLVFHLRWDIHASHGFQHQHREHRSDEPRRDAVRAEASGADVERWEGVQEAGRWEHGTAEDEE